ncbi:MAG: type II and III secretion system protein [Deltaproteobacteria bacterium]|nr:type II and III secretion system protein [Deltaproteobacteria bacterium]
MEKTRYILFFFLLQILSFSQGWAIDLPDRTIVLAIGASVVLPLEDSAILAIENDAVVSAETDEAQHLFRLTARSKGRTSLQYGKEDLSASKKRIELIVVDKETYEMYREATTALEGVEGIAIRPMGEEILISGEILLFRDAEKIKEFSKSGKKITVAATISPLAYRVAAEELNHSLENSTLSGVKARGLSHGILLDGEVANEKEKEILLQMAGKFADPVIDSVETTFSDAPIISLEIAIAEIKRKQAREIGLEWPNVVEVSTQWTLPDPNRSFSWQGSPITLDLFLHLAESRQVGRVIASPHLSCRSGEEARFFAGGELPIETKSYRKHEVTWKPHGITLTIKPQANQRDFIAAILSAEISTLQANPIGNSNLPQLSTKRISTALTVPSGTAVILGGLISQEESHKKIITPFLSSLPFLGTLFRTDAKERSEHELLIAVIPRIVRDESALHKEEIKKFREKMEYPEEK